MLLFVERYLPPSQAFVLTQVGAYRRFRPEFMASRRLPSVDPIGTGYPVHEIRRSVRMTIGALLLKVPRIGVPALFPALANTRLVHAHIGKNGYVIGPLARRARLPLVTTFHGFDATFNGDPAEPGGFNQVRYFSRGRREMAANDRWNIAVSDFVRDRLIDVGFAPERVFRHYIGIDRTLFQPDAQRRRRGRVVSIARFEEVKGHRYMIDALAKVAAQGIPVEFVMVGQGPIRSEIEAYGMKRLPKVTVFDRLDQTEIRALLGSAQVYLHGSTTLQNGAAEALGIANLEAQAVGTPVVAFDSGGVGEAIDPGASGFLVGERNVNDMADAVARLLSDGALWRAFHARAPAFVADRFDVFRQTDRLEDYFETVLADHAEMLRK